MGTSGGMMFDLREPASVEDQLSEANELRWLAIERGDPFYDILAELRLSSIANAARTAELLKRAQERQRQREARKPSE